MYYLNIVYVGRYVIDLVQKGHRHPQIRNWQFQKNWESCVRAHGNCMEISV